MFRLCGFMGRFNLQEFVAMISGSFSSMVMAQQRGWIWRPPTKKDTCRRGGKVLRFRFVEFARLMFDGMPKLDSIR